MMTWDAANLFEGRSTGPTHRTGYVNTGGRRGLGGRLRFRGTQPVPVLILVRGTKYTGILVFGAVHGTMDP